MNHKKRLIIRTTASFKNTMLLGLILLVMSFFIMPEAIRQIRLYAHGTGMIDTQLFFFPDQAYAMIASYGDRGRQLYTAVELTADLFYSIVAALFFCSLLIWSSGRSKNNAIDLEYLIWLPFSLFLVNCLENAGIVWMLSAFPERLDALAMGTAVCLVLKWLLAATCAVIAGWNLLLYSRSSILQLNGVDRDGGPGAG